MDALDVLQTRASFDYQWLHLPQNRWSLASATYREEVPGFVARLLDVPPAWFAGREVLDAGCGCGRHAFALCRLGARVLAVDRSLPAVRATRAACAPFTGFRGAVAADLLHPLPTAGSFDLVWSFGVLHHTGNLPRALRSLRARLRPGGLLFLMLYGRPRPGHASDAEEIASLEAWRSHLAPLPFPAKVEALQTVARGDEILEYFDAVSPSVNERYPLAEVEGWLASEGFVDVRRRLDLMDHYLVARRA
jgi:SAM-dependent methyltransferase